MSVINNFLTGCAEDCDDVVLLPAIPAEQDCTSYEQELSQICDFYLLPTGVADIFADWATTPTYVALSIDNTEALNAKAKHLVGIGGVAEPSVTELEYPKLKTRVVEGLYVKEFRIFQMSGGQYDFLRKLQCGSTGFTFYYADLAGFVYGKAGGIEPSSVRVTFPKGAGNGDRNQAILRVSWRADGDPERRVNPIV